MNIENNENNGNNENNISTQFCNILCIAHPRKFNDWLPVTILRGAVLNKSNRDWDTHIWIPIINNICAVSFNKNQIGCNEIEYVGNMSEEINKEVRAYNIGNATLNEIAKMNEQYCILTIPYTYLLGLSNF